LIALFGVADAEKENKTLLPEMKLAVTSKQE